MDGGSGGLGGGIGLGGLRGDIGPSGLGAGIDLSTSESLSISISSAFLLCE